MQRVLAAAVPGSAVHCSHRAVGVDDAPCGKADGAQGASAGEEDEGVATVHFANRVPPVSARLVVAADGLRSAVRRQLAPADKAEPRQVGGWHWGRAGGAGRSQS